MEREEQLKLARQLLESGVLSEESANAIKADFLELAESEDERIIDGFHTLLKGIRRDGGLTLNKVPLDKCEEWLEKQKEQKPAIIKPHKGDGGNPYDMGVSEAQEYAIKRGFGIPFNDGEVFVDERYITQTIGNILRWADEHPKEQKPNIELIQRSWYMEGYHDREFGREPKWIIKTGKYGPKYEENEKYGQPLEQKTAELSEFEVKLWEIMKAEGSAVGPREKFTNDDKRAFHEYSAQLLALARKELQPEIDAEVEKAYKNADRMQYEKGRDDALKDLPRWKKCAPCDEDKATIPAWIVRFDAELAGESAVVHNGHYILFGELEKLPKEE